MECEGQMEDSYLCTLQILAQTLNVVVEVAFHKAWVRPQLHNLDPSSIQCRQHLPNPLSLAHLLGI